MDDLTKRGRQDRERVNVSEGHETRYWCEKWSVTHEELVAAVAAVGPMTKDVEAYLVEHHGRP